MDVVVEGLRGFGRLFLHPLTYVFIMVAYFVGLARVKRERKHFHIRVFDFILELKYLFFPGILIGLVLSVFTILLGTYLSLGTIALIGVITFLLSGPFTFRWLSPVFVLGFAMIAALLIPQDGLGSGMVANLVMEAKDMHLPSVVVLMSLLLLAEGFLIWKYGHKGTSPIMVTSKRGQEVGAHFSQKLWVVPVFTLIPGDAITSIWSWWPVLTVNNATFSLCLVPFAIGFSQRVKGMLPIHSISFTGKRVLGLGVFITLASIAAFFYPLVSIYIAVIAIFIREFITIHQRMTDERAPVFFSKRDSGLVILGIIPMSPAEKMSLRVGEVITKVNGLPVLHVSSFYEALQANNRAYCKLEVVDENGEVRFAQRALYDNEHHELGIIFVQNYQKRESEVDVG
ncbi:PDZ domain-containing protein [Bacillus sp. CGMCC 1.16541]|uniref:PDZ domain-containing protein n=1 Tax=Bacillus sp. CGMCC 1.16541 TaxID=2185143 RepID=UPI000D73E2C0|nr:PDZ domain-containing protein [Bacillus sp. CGMCC 1.16541]